MAIVKVTERRSSRKVVGRVFHGIRRDAISRWRWIAAGADSWHKWSSCRHQLRLVVASLTDEAIIHRQDA